MVAVCATAEPIPTLKPGNYVNDFAHVLSPATVAQLNDAARQIDQDAHAQIALVTINTLDGSDIESYAVELFHQWGIGYKGTDRGVLILYVIQDRRARIEVGYGLEPILPDGKVGGFQREAIPQMKAGDYDGALTLVFGRVAQTIAADAKITLNGLDQQVAPQRTRPTSDDQSSGIGVFGWIVIVIVLIVIFTSPAGQFIWVIFNILSIFSGGGRGGGGWGGGGFGGGGGGFGGFGGGSSGGGGASSSW